MAEIQELRKTVQDLTTVVTQESEIQHSQLHLASHQVPFAICGISFKRFDMTRSKTDTSTFVYIF